MHAIPLAFFARPAEEVGPELIGCRLVKRLPNGELLWGVIVETEAYSQDEPACHGHRRRSPQNETLFGAPGRFYVYVSYGIHHCVNVVTDRQDWANGVLLRAVAVPGEPERVAAGPGLLARRFGIDRGHDSRPVTGQHDVAGPAAGIPRQSDPCDHNAHRHLSGRAAAAALVSAGQSKRQSPGQGGSHTSEGPGLVPR